MKRARVVIVTALVLCGCCGLLVSADETERARAGRGFTDVTVEAGVDKVMAAHLANVPQPWMSGLDLIDVDGDGDLDLHLGSHGSRPAAAAWNDGKGHFTYVDPKPAVPRGRRYKEDVPYGGGEIRIAHDFNHDGKVDLLCAYGDYDGVLHLNDCRAGDPPTWNFKRYVPFGPFSRGLALIDINRDGVLDYLQDAGQNIAVYPGKPDGWFAEKALLIPGAFDQAGFIPVDVDGDGDIDILTHGNDKGNYYAAGGQLTRRLLLNDGKMHFTDVAKEAGLAERPTSIHGVGDLDRDGDLDLICVSPRGHPEPVSIWINDGKGHFAHRAEAAKIVGRRPHVDYPYWGGAIVTDFNNDGVPDFAINWRNRMLVFRGLGGGDFVLASDEWGLPSSAWCAVDDGTCFGDIDGDGDLDFVVSGAGGEKPTVFIMRNDLPKRHWLRVRPAGKGGNAAAAGAKIRIYEAGAMGDPKRLVWFEQVAIWGRQSFHSYYAASRTERHFGLGERTSVDVSVEFYPSGKKVEKRNVPADTTVDIRE